MQIAPASLQGRTVVFVLEPRREIRIKPAAFITLGTVTAVHETTQQAQISFIYVSDTHRIATILVPFAHILAVDGYDLYGHDLLALHELARPVPPAQTTLPRAA